jgi:predicted metal-dependent hydrolase
MGQQGLINQRVVTEFFDYFSSRFHPNQHDSVAIQQIWRERLALNA